MKIIVLNGSPKSDTSFTMQYVHYIRKKFLEHDWKIYNVAKEIKAIEMDEEKFNNVINEVKSADCVLWAFSVHFFLVPSQYKRFIELVFEKGAENVFRNKYAALLVTSIHFFDHTAISYMNAICDDMGMNFIGSFSADMYDLEKNEERKRLIKFATDFFSATVEKRSTATNYAPLLSLHYDYVPDKVQQRIALNGKKVIIMTDLRKGEDNLQKMLDRFKNCFEDKVETVNLHDVDIKGGCLGCIRCGPDNVCSYHSKDGFDKFYNSIIEPADVLVFAGVIRDRYLSSTWKMFFDRSFFNTHIPTLADKQLGFIISGPLRQIPVLREIFSAYAEWQQANLVDFITDEYADSRRIDLLLYDFAKKCVGFANQNYKQPPTFLGVGGMKIFRDDTWGRFRFILQGNHRFFKRHGMYDFPQRDLKARLMNMLMIPLTKIPMVRREFAKRIHVEMVKPLKKIVGGMKQPSDKG